MDTMEKLLASQPLKITKITRGQPVEGKVVAIGEKEITLDLGAKSEGILPTRDLEESFSKKLKIGDQLKAYVVIPENESGQIILSLLPAYPSGRNTVNWARFSAAQRQKSKLQGTVKEVNAGGLIIETAGSRGFMPYSQIGLEFLGREPDSLKGEQITFSVIEADQTNNKLVFSQKEAQSEEFVKQAGKYKPDEMVKGEVVNISESGISVKLEGKVEGFLKAAKMDTGSKYAVGKSMSFLVDSIDENRQRVNLVPFVTSTAGLIYK